MFRKRHFFKNYFVPKDNQGSAAVEIAFVFPIIIVIILFFIDLIRFVQIKHSIEMLANELARDFALTGRINTFEKKIEALDKTTFLIPNMKKEKKLSYYINMYNDTNEIQSSLPFFDQEGCGYNSSGIDCVIADKQYDNESLQRYMFFKPDIYVGAKYSNVMGKRVYLSNGLLESAKPVEDFVNVCLYDEQFYQNTNRRANVGIVVVVYKIKLLISMFKFLINDRGFRFANKDAEEIPIMGTSIVVRKNLQSNVVK